MSNRAKYLNLIVTLAFVVGQVQFAYSYYFCTMKQMPVSTPTMSMTPTTAGEADGICGECEGVIPSQHGQQLVEGNCIKLIAADKSVVGNFTEWAKFKSHVHMSFTFVQTDGAAQPFSRQNFVLLSPANSPPLDLPILNSNLRI